MIALTLTFVSSLISMLHHLAVSFLAFLKSYPHFSICLSVCFYNPLSLSLSLSLSLFLSLSGCLCIYLSIYMPVCLSVCLPVCLSVYLSLSSSLDFLFDTLLNCIFIYLELFPFIYSIPLMNYTFFLRKRKTRWNVFPGKGYLNVTHIIFGVRHHG